LTVPIIPELLRAKVRVFADLYRKTQQLARLNHELTQRVAERTAALQQAEAATVALQHALAERQRLEQEVQRAQQYTLLGRMDAGVSHEIRNPLAAIFLHVDLLDEELRQPSPESPGQMADALTEIKR
jgi:C4-dicarboxylate-specific signal transduction histidine kinase